MNHVIKARDAYAIEIKKRKGLTADECVGCVAFVLIFVTLGILAFWR